jgi:hypothetical protein
MPLELDIVGDITSPVRAIIPSLTPQIFSRPWDSTCKYVGKSVERVARVIHVAQKWEGRE